MQPDLFERTIDSLHGVAEQTFADAQAPACPLPVGLSGIARPPISPAGTGILLFLDVHGAVSEPVAVTPETTRALAGDTADEQLVRAASDHDAVCAVLSLPVHINLERLVCADPAALARSADPRADRHAHPGVLTIAAYTAPAPTAPLERLSLTCGKHLVRITPHPDGSPMPPPAARWLRLLLP